ncbi:hypothetical protein TSUD_320250 [Trifolium subterraneum]|uniref:RNase H type-1 domain-containing protein n=1 Tax=Trifolium subterraneum TaxID=3900 RepID=A0A2Z6N8Y9_TRISU|nr:hypothetical protein TSUD_320250 [Trifolium subterraneum]
MLRLNWEVKLKHIYREGNYCTDDLANMAINLPEGIVLMYAPMELGYTLMRM